MPTPILIALPDPAQASRLAHLLLELGHECDAVHTGQEALQRVQSDEPLHLLITEIELPGANGVAIVQELRRRRDAAQTAVVVLTGSPQFQNTALQLRHELGIDAVLSLRTAALTLNEVFQRALAGKGGTRAMPGLLSPAAAFAKLNAENAGKRLSLIAGMHLAADLPRDEALQKLAADACRFFGYPCALLRLTSGAGNEGVLHWPQQTNSPAWQDEAWDFLAPRGSDATLAPYLVAEAGKSPTLKAQALVKLGLVNGFVSLPLTSSDGTRLGFLALIDQATHDLEPALRDLLRPLGRRLGGELMANTLLHEMRQNITSQWQTATEREERLELLKGVLQSLHLGVLLHDSEGKVVFANARLAEMWGMDEKTLAKLSPGRFHERISGLFARPEGYLASLPDLDAGPFEAEQMLEPQRPRRQVLRWTARPIHGGLDWYQLNLWEDLSASLEAQAERDRLATIDPLTELLNRRGAEEELHRESERARRKGRHYSLLRLHLHHLDEINRDKGHAEGDLVLQAVGVCLRSCLRVIDRPARWSGRQFMVLLPETPLKDAILVAYRIRKAINELNLGYRLDVCIGAANSEGQPDGLACLAACDERLLKACESPDFIA